MRNYITYRLRLEPPGRVRVDKSGPDGQLGEPGGALRFDIQRHELGRLRDAAAASELDAAGIARFGELLFDVLFDESLARDFLHTYEDVRRADGYVRVELDIPELDLPDVAAMPWELLCIPADQGTGVTWFATDPNMVLVRRQARWQAPELIRLSPGERLRIAVAAAQPRSTEDVELGPVQYGKVWEDLSALAEQHDNQVELLDLLEDASAIGIDHLLAQRPHIFHFVGHGRLRRAGNDGADKGEVGEVFLAGAANLPDPYEAAEFSEIFLRHRPGIVLLHTCEGAAMSTSRAFTGVASQLVAQGVPVVVAMQFEISNAVGRRFIRRFYECLAHGHPIDQAVQEGRRTIALGVERNRSLGFATPVVYMRTPQGRLFDATVAGNVRGEGGAGDEPQRPVGERRTEDGLRHATASEADADAPSTYAAWVAERFRRIELRGVRLDGNQVMELDLDEVYVPLEADAYVRDPQRGRGRSEGPQTRPIEMPEMLSVGRRLILTGGPGSGKTTVLLHMAHTLGRAVTTSDYSLAAERLGLATELPLPVFVPLSAFAAHLRTLKQSTYRVEPDDYSLAKFIPYYLNQHSAVKTSERLFERLLDTGEGVMLLLDGLDEVPNEAERVRVRQAVEDFVVGRPDMRVVVSCRTAAHKGRTALGRGFLEVRVKPLDTPHLVRLIDKAYTHLYADDDGSREYMTEELLRAVARLEFERRRRLGPESPPLIDSPLLVRLLFIVHHSNEGLPARRAELYARATDVMLLPDYGPDEAVSDAIGSLVGGDQALHRRLVTYLAFNIHRRGESQGRELDEAGLRGLLDAVPAFAALTEDFVSLTRLRGTVLEERLGQYRFLHLAFQEFLTARYLAEAAMAGGLDELVSFLESGPLLDTWWREPVLLLLGWLSIEAPSVAAELTRRMLAAGAQEPEGPRKTATQMAAAEVVAAGLTEWESIPTTVYDGTKNRLAEFFAGDRALLSQVNPRLRAATGAALGLLGDDRVGSNNSDAIDLCLVRAGPFRMGSRLKIEAEVDDDDRRMSLESERFLHEVNLDYDYWLGRHPVTNAQFVAFVESGGYDDPSLWPEAEATNVWRAGQVRRWYWEGQNLTSNWESGPYDYGFPFNLPNHPVVGICWYEALGFMRWLQRRWRERGWITEELSVCFPSEAEWEKAGRGGVEVPIEPDIRPPAEILEAVAPGPVETNDQPDRLFPWGDDDNLEHCNARETGIGTTSAIGCFPEAASPYGCEDLVGNVFEWTRTLWGRQRETSGAELEFDVLYSYPYNPVDGREDLRADGFYLRVPRGGAHFIEGRYCRCSFRDMGAPSFRFSWDGFRVALVRTAIVERNTAVAARR